MTGRYFGGWPTGEWLAMAFVMIGFWVLVVVVVTWAIRSNRRVRDDVAWSAPERILDERFARGDIDDDEYHRRRDVLVGATRRGDDE